VSGLNIRRALPDEATSLTEIARAAKRHWGYPDEWMKLWREALTVTPTYVSAHEVFLGEVGSEIIGFYALVQAARSWELDHLWVRPAFIGRGFGRLLFTHAVERLQAVSPGAALDIESDPHAEPFYLHMGARRVGEISRDWQGLKRTLPRLRFSASAS
jgi:ribosomal protein S18 acetylase RimI-like enzyme